jgi:hypothetical protein
MVDFLQSVRASGNAAPLTGRPLVVELAGPAAAGKSSLLVALAQSDTTLTLGPHLPRYRHVATALHLAPTFFALHRPLRGSLWKEMKRITYLGTLQSILEEPTSQRGGGVVLDEGAVYMLARLRVYGGERIRGDAFERWWRSAIDRWANILDIIVWLDAPDPVLIHRLRARQQDHTVKGLSDDAIRGFIGSYRAAYDRVIGALAAANGPTVLTVRSDQESMSHTVQRALARMTERRMGHR